MLTHTNSQKTCFYLYFSGKCFFGSVFNLEESIKFLHRHDKSPLEKAKLEMVVSMRERIKEDKIDVKSSIIKEYLKILD